MDATLIGKPAPTNLLMSLVQDLSNDESLTQHSALSTFNAGLTPFP
jgi:hypothetical protein